MTGCDNEHKKRENEHETMTGCDSEYKSTVEPLTENEKIQLGALVLKGEVKRLLIPQTCNTTH